MKKNPGIDLRKKRVVFLWLGRAFTLGLVAIVFEFATFPSSRNFVDTFIIEGDLEELPPATIEKIVPPPPPPKKITVIEIVEDTKELPEEVVFDNADVTDDTPIDFEEIPEIEEEVVEAAVVLDRSDVMPSFPGGNNELFKYLGKNLKYPKMAVDSNISGRVYLQFVVEKDGSISNIHLARGIGGGCDEEAVRVLKSMPKWSPGKNKGLPVRVKFTLPVNFVLK